MSSRSSLILAAIGMAIALSSVPASAEGKKLVFALPGVPPIYAGVVAYVAEKESFFKKHGADVELKNFDNGTAAARAVIAGDIDMALSPTPPVINQISNADAPLVAIWGLPSPDWIVATTEDGKSCKDIAGQPVGVDAIGGARSVALRTMLVGCPGVKIEDTQQVALGSNTAPAMIAGRLAYGVLHLDDIAVIEAQGKKVHTLLAMEKTNPTSHYIVLVARPDKVKANRDAYVRAVAALTEAARFMQDPNNADKVADDAAPTGHPKAINKAALKEFLGIGFWATKDDGMDRKKMEAVIAVMKKTGGIKPDKEPVKYERLTDPSIWQDANAMIK